MTKSIAWMKKVDSEEAFQNLTKTRKKKVLNDGCCEYDKGKCLVTGKECYCLKNNVCSRFEDIVLVSFRQWHRLEEK